MGRSRRLQEIDPRLPGGRPIAVIAPVSVPVRIPYRGPILVAPAIAPGMPVLPDC